MRGYTPFLILLLTASPALADEPWAVHLQATGTEQYHPNIRSPYSGPNSLSAKNEGKEGTDFTLFAGLHLWEGAQFWANPEIDQGFGLSGTVGLAGFSNGESAKVGRHQPYARLPRAFLRQTIALGGGTETVDPDLNQLGGSQPTDRLVVTVGKFSVVDIFDNNRYAHDPRNDFLNWTLIDMGAFDYAADAWGYSYGGAVEWIQDWWSLRTGLFDGSRVANGTALTIHGLDQYQWVFEAEERHSLGGRPGVLRALTFLTHARLASYTEALGLADPAPVRHPRDKWGYGLNLEQQLTDDLGLFARLSAQDGGIEAYEFTDVDESLSGGLSATGGRWGRPDDTIALGGAVNLSSSRLRRFLAAGGLGVLVGDGRLPNAGPEQLLETYYNFAAAPWAHVTADYQFVHNPAYNRDRGPVSIFGLRVHLQY